MVVPYDFVAAYDLAAAYSAAAYDAAAVVVYDYVEQDMQCFVLMMICVEAMQDLYSSLAFPADCHCHFVLAGGSAASPRYVVCLFASHSLSASSEVGVLAWCGILQSGDHRVDPGNCLYDCCYESGQHSALVVG